MVKSRDNPSSIFFWKDYENDAGLRISSLAAQGLWMRLLCVAAKAEPYGYILINGIALDYIGAARIAGVTESEAESLMLELERNGVFSRDRRRRPFSRRMVKEKAKSEKNRKNGVKGGNPALIASDGKQTEKDKSLKPEVKVVVKAPLPTPPFPSDTSYPHGGGGGADARPSAPIFERLLVALGFDPSDPPKPWQGAATHVLGWQLVRGLSDDDLVEAATIFRQSQPAPMGGPTALDLHIAAYAKAKRVVAQPEATPPADTLREALLGAMGLDPVSGLTGHGGTRLGTQADMALAGRWLALPGMTPQIVCAEIARIVADKADGPPKSFKYFTAAMQRLSGVLTAPALEPTQSAQNPNGNRHEPRTANPSLGPSPRQGDRVDPALANIARIAGLGLPPGNGCS